MCPASTASKHLPFAGAWPTGKDASREYSGKEHELCGQRTEFVSQLRKSEQINGDNVCESTWLSVFQIKIIQQRFIDLFPAS